MEKELVLNREESIKTNIGRKGSSDTVFFGLLFRFGMEGVDFEGLDVTF